MSYMDYPEIRELVRECLHCGVNSWSKPLCDLCYIQIHAYIKARKKITVYCQECYKIKKVDLANISQEYKHDIEDYEWLCRKCHSVKYKVERHNTLIRRLAINEVKNQISIKETGMPSLGKIIKSIGWF